MTLPRVIHRLWVGGPMPEHLEAYGDTWHQHHPGWTHMLWTDENLPVLRNQRLYDEAEYLVPADAVGQFRADIARYDLILTHGGIWTDCDLEALRPVDDLVAGLDCFAAWEQERRWVNNAFMGATAGHPFLQALVDGLPGNVRRRRGARPNVMSGPQYLTGVYRRHAKHVTVLAKRLVYPYSWSDLGTPLEQGPWPDAWVVHHWHHRRSLRTPA